MSDDKNYREVDVIMADIAQRIESIAGITKGEAFALGFLVREYGAARAATASMAMAKPMLDGIAKIAQDFKDAADADGGDEPWKG